MILEGTMKEYAPVLSMPVAIVSPGRRWLGSPARRTKVTVPPVEGVHEMFADWPAVKARPDGGILKAFCAAARAPRERAIARMEIRILAAEERCWVGGEKE